MAAVFGIVATFAPGAPLPAAAASGIGADPLAKRVDFGWLPASLPNVSYIATAGNAGTEAVAEGNKTPDGAPRVDLMLLSDDGLSTLNGNERWIPVHLDDGRKAYWVTQSVGGELRAISSCVSRPRTAARAEMAWSVNWSGVYSFADRRHAWDRHRVTIRPDRADLRPRVAAMAAGPRPHGDGGDGHSGTDPVAPAHTHGTSRQLQA